MPTVGVYIPDYIYKEVLKEKKGISELIQDAIIEYLKISREETKKQKTINSLFGVV